MKSEIIWSDKELLPRCYIAAARLKNFRGHPGVGVQLFRTGANNKELEQIRRLGLVRSRSPEMPAQFLGSLDEDAALGCLLECFTREEAQLLEKYLRERYGDQLIQLIICPIEMPVPLGVGPLAQIPESSRSGFINFDLAQDYPLPFRFKGYYDLDDNSHQP